MNQREPERIGYFADWNVANRGYTVNELRNSGAPEHLTRLMWAFGNIDRDGLCFIPEDSHDQPWELYQRRYGEDESVSGEADEYEQELAGGLNQLRQLRAEYPDLGASLSLGGWNWSVNFSTAARTEESREAFVTSCLDLWLRGNLPVRGGEPQGGEGVAAGVFDGIDLDWEWPGGQGNPDNVEHPDDARNFTLLVAEFRRQMDELSRETGDDYLLSVSLPGERRTPRPSRRSSSSTSTSPPCRATTSPGPGTNAPPTTPTSTSPTTTRTPTAWTRPSSATWTWAPARIRS